MKEYTEELESFINKLNLIEINKCFIISDVIPNYDRALQNRLKGYLSVLIKLNYISIVSKVGNGSYVYQLNKEVEL